MRVLLDTNAVLWQYGSVRPLGPLALAAIEGADDIAVSVVSYIEVGTKQAVGKLDVPADFRVRVEAGGARTLPLTADHGLALCRLPLHHHDPFDRLLVVQAQAEDMALVSADKRLRAYDVRVIDALA